MEDAERVCPNTFIRQSPPKVAFTNFPLPLEHNLSLEDRRAINRVNSVSSLFVRTPTIISKITDKYNNHQYRISHPLYHNLVRGLIHLDPKMRMSLATAEQHPYFHLETIRWISKQEQQATGGVLDLELCTYVAIANPNW